MEKVICTFNKESFFIKDVSKRLTVGKEYTVLEHIDYHKVKIIDNLNEESIFNIVRFNDTGKRWSEESIN